MKLVVGLGNPGQEYADTRHNLGFQVVDVLAERWQVPAAKSKFHGLFGDGTVAGVRCGLLKPMTFMNRSGRSVAAAAGFFKLEPADVLLVLDDLDLPCGRLRIRKTGSAGGHRGLDDVLRALATPDIARVRIGIGRGRGDDTVSHVLSRFSSDESAAIEALIPQTADAVECWLTEGPDAAMNRFNAKPAEPG